MSVSFQMISSLTPIMSVLRQSKTLAVACSQRQLLGTLCEVSATCTVACLKCFRVLVWSCRRHSNTPPYHGDFDVMETMSKHQGERPRAKKDSQSSRVCLCAGGA